MAYQAACRRCDVAAAVACFADSGVLEFAGGQLTGRAALLDAHRWDCAARNEVALLDPAVNGEQVAVTFVNQHELHRVLGIAPMRSPAEIVVRDGRLQLFRILAPEPDNLQALLEKAGPFFAWVSAHHPQAWQRTAVLDEAGGQALFDLAHAWRQHTEVKSNQ